MKNKYKPLKDKVYVVDTKFFNTKLQRGITVIDVFIKEDIISAVKLYKKYHNNYDLFIADHPKVLDNCKLYCWLNEHNFDNDYDRNNEFNCYLFEYCFEDALK